MYIPYILRSFQVYKTKDIKEFHSKQHMVLILEPEEGHGRLCRKCGSVLGRKRGKYFVEAKHLKVFSWSSSVRFPV